MNIPQAQRLVGRWRHILVPGYRITHTDADAARVMERSFLGLAIGPLPAFFVFAASGSLPLLHWPLSVIIPALGIMLVSYWLSM
jgi:hypothetical protein